MKMQWEKFEGKQYRTEARREPRVTLGAKGTFYLNGVAYDALERPAAVEMLYEGNRRIIGLKPIDPRRDNAFLIKHHGKGRQLQTPLSCRLLLAVSPKVQPHPAF
jgi:hypothetical protein